MNFIGIDVSKQKLDCALMRGNHPGKPLHKVVANSVEGIQMLLAFVRLKAGDDAELRAVLEAAGSYHDIAAEACAAAAARYPSSIRPVPKISPKGLASKPKPTKRMPPFWCASAWQCRPSLRFGNRRLRNISGLKTCKAANMRLKPTSGASAIVWKNSRPRT